MNGAESEHSGETCKGSEEEEAAKKELEKKTRDN